MHGRTIEEKERKREIEVNEYLGVGVLGSEPLYAVEALHKARLVLTHLLILKKLKLRNSCIFSANLIVQIYTISMLS